MLRTPMMLSLLALLALTGCKLDSEEALRQRLIRQVYLLDTVHFASSSTCTAAVFTLALAEFRNKFAAAGTVKAALRMIEQGQPVHFYMPEVSPNEISERLMSHNLPSGLGLISAAVGPAQNCMPDQVSRGYFRVLMSPETQLVYLPKDNALLLVYVPEKLAFYLRSNV
ncbi:hypothetical protein KO498_02765 [Lentibacter algarum]|uniref:hypothetical protein n=1 Tax=Lentibacter algarum TaxID=576131 RepID=UPI001C06F902|nr:hypothetical protein [Lentibacter algarum]MBU2980727.1 hypothetical protein [Lentibacter algarum]